MDSYWFIDIADDTDTDRKKTELVRTKTAST